MEISCEICCTGCIFGHASVRPNELRSGRLNGQSADLFTDLTNRDFVTALDFSFIEQPIDGNGRIAFDYAAHERNRITGIDRIISSREGNDLRQN